MPTYTNSGTKRVSFQNLEWSPGEVKKLPYFVPHTLLGLDMTAPEPFVNQPEGLGFGAITLAINGETIYDVPYSDVVEISVWAGEGGPAQMFVGDSLTSITIDESNNHVGRYLWSKVGYLKFAGAGSVQITVNPIERGFKDGR